jgi:FkbM family methyltransferase
MIEIFPSFTSSFIKPIQYFLMHRTYRRYVSWLVKFKLFPPSGAFQLRIDRWHLSIPDSASFLSNYRSIFCDRIYDFESENPAPRILDLGANIGLSILFFKEIYPQAQIIALEPDPQLFSYLKHNIYGNGYEDVDLRDQAAWHCNTMIPFNASLADDGHIILNDTLSKETLVKAIDISQLLSAYRFDFIKMDIEGAEKFVLPACQPYLESVQYVFVEYHAIPDQPQELSKILNILESSGFRLYLQTIGPRPFPFRSPATHQGRFDFQTNIYAWRS